MKRAFNKEFATAKPNQAGRIKIEAARCAFDDCLLRLIDYVPIGREMSLVRTKLEEASFFAVKAIANDPENQEIDA